MVQDWIERIIRPLLIISPFVLGFSEQLLARSFYITMGFSTIAKRLMTDYQGNNHSII